MGSQVWLGTGFLYACTYCPKYDRTSQATSICLFTKFQVKKKELVTTTNFRRSTTTWFAYHAAFTLKALLICWSCYSRKDGKWHYLAQLLLSTFTKRTVSLNHTAWSYDSLNRSENELPSAAALGRCCREGHREVRAKLLADTALWKGTGYSHLQCGSATYRKKNLHAFLLLKIGIFYQCM